MSGAQQHNNMTLTATRKALCTGLAVVAAGSARAPHLAAFAIAPQQQLQQQQLQRLLGYGSPVAAPSVTAAALHSMSPIGDVVGERGETVSGGMVAAFAAVCIAGVRRSVHKKRARIAVRGTSSSTTTVGPLTKTEGNSTATRVTTTTTTTTTSHVTSIGSTTSSSAGKVPPAVPEVSKKSNLPAGIYCERVETCTRRKTRTVMIGGVPVGSDHPIAVQTMGTTSTDNVEETVAQIKKCADAGVDIVRITVQGMREAKACEFIKKRLLEDGYKTPLVADIHFTPKVALHVADFVDKVRINPGNFADGKKSFDTITELTDTDVQEHVAEIEKSLTPLVLKLKDLDKAMRIGVNHGSLSERILFQYGDSPEGMVASAVEVVEICRKNDYHNLIISMKSSNPKVMINAYRMMAKDMYQRGWDYPLHLGVTEAGGGSDGRIKSAVGIGALLLDGLGDTIRVSLTEDPEYEIHPCKALRQAAENAVGKGVEPFDDTARRESHHSKRACDFPIDVPLNSDGTVMMSITPAELENISTNDLSSRVGLRLRADGDIQKDWKSADLLLVDGDISASSSTKLKTLIDLPLGVACRPGPNAPAGATLLYQAADINEPLEQRIGGFAVIFNGTESPEVIERAVTNSSPRFFMLKPASTYGATFLARRFFNRMTSIEAAAKLPLMLWFDYPKKAGQDEDDIVIKASADFGSLFVDGIGEGLLWEAADLAPENLRVSTFNLLQASRMRITKTEFISCPSCGRTLFNLQATTARIQSRTGHLPGVRIAVMGCIVNGPGEMADADFGYVGSGAGKIDLYVNYDVVKRGIPSENAVDALVQLIKDNGKWAEPQQEVEEVTSMRHSAVAAVL